MSTPTKCPFCGTESMFTAGTSEKWLCATFYDGEYLRSNECYRNEVKSLNTRIARLEKAGDELEVCAKYACTNELVNATVDNWRKAIL